MKLVLNPTLFLALFALYAQLVLFLSSSDTPIQIAVSATLGVSILVFTMYTRNEYLIASHFIDLIEECIEEKTTSFNHKDIEGSN
ncbi:hypothetical protein ACTHQ4_20090 [Alkalicoccobacillus gibsonii]|uniref:hypothetical protein n=1 Tax=Alkalicoccobacillus gibsonii TaxID=79881 RepID=UPI003F7C5049